MILSEIELFAVDDFELVVFNACFLTYKLYLLDGSVNQTLNAINLTIVKLNTPKTGTIDQLNNTIDHIGGVANQSQKILRHEQRNLNTLDKQEVVFFSDLHDIALNTETGIKSFQQTTIKLNKNLDSSNKVLQKFPSLVNQLTVTTMSLNAKINDPRVEQLLTNLTATSVQLKKTSVQVTATAKDVRKVSDHVTKVITKKKGIAGKIWIGVKIAWSFAWQIASVKTL